MLAQPLGHLAAGTTLLKLGGGHVLAGKTPEATQQGAIISPTDTFAIEQILSRHARQKDAAPTAQVLNWESGRGWGIELRAASAGPTRPECHQTAPPNRETAG